MKVALTQSSKTLATLLVLFGPMVALLLACQRLPAGESPGAGPGARSTQAAEVQAAPDPRAASPRERERTPSDDENRIVNLFDAFGQPIPGTRHAFGFSALVRYEGLTILFDAGSSADVLEQNVRALGFDLRQVDFAVASHSHFDHVSGFDYLLAVNPDVKIYFPEDIYWGAPFDYDASGPDKAAGDALPAEQRYFGGGPARFRWSSSGRFWKANVEFLGKHAEVAPGVHLIATRSPYVGYFSRYPAVGGHGKFKGSGETKLIELPELSLSLDTAEGEVLVLGCSHSLVDAITREARSHLGRDVHLVLGGFHLLPYGAEEIREIIRRMQGELFVRNVAPAHCTGHLGFKLFQEAYGEHYHLAGLGSSIPFPRRR